MKLELDVRGQYHTFNNYVYQILPIFEPPPHSSGEKWNYTYYLPFVMWTSPATSCPRSYWMTFMAMAPEPKEHFLCAPVDFEGNFLLQSNHVRFAHGCHCGWKCKMIPKNIWPIFVQRVWYSQQMLNSSMYRILRPNLIHFENLAVQKNSFWILTPFLSEAVEASLHYFFEDWLIKLKFPNLPNPLGIIIQ